MEVHRLVGPPPPHAAFSLHIHLPIRSVANMLSFSFQTVEDRNRTSFSFPLHVHLPNNPLRSLSKMPRFHFQTVEDRNKIQRAAGRMFLDIPIHLGLSSYLLMHVQHTSPRHELPSIKQIISIAKTVGVKLELCSWGPYFQVIARNSESEELGTINGFVTIWKEGRILHLESVRMRPLSLKYERPLFGIPFLLGAAAIRYGYDCRCTNAELLAVNDGGIYHAKLLRYYSRMGFKVVYEVTGDSWRDIPHMLVWGAVGTRMDAAIIDLMKKWSPAFRHKLPQGMDNL